MVHGNPIFQAPPIFKGFPWIFRFAFFLSRTWIAWWRSFNPSWKLRRKCICRCGFGVMIGFHKWLRNKNCLLKQTHLQSCGMESMNYRDKLPSLVGHIKKNTYICIYASNPYPTIFNNCLFFMLEICDFRESTHPISSWKFSPGDAPSKRDGLGPWWNLG